MKKLIAGALFILLVVSAANTQEGVPVKSRYYEILAAADNADAALLGRELDLRYEAYNALFRFDSALRQGTLKVRLFTDKSAYDTYISSKLGSTRDGAVYLHYNTADNRALVIHRGREARVLAHQAFVQFLRAFIPNPPSWIREGAAAYFNGLSFNSQRSTLDYEENLAWLETAKKLGRNLPSPEAVLQADKSGVPGNFQAASWVLVSFFVSGSKEQYRTLTDSFMVLSPTASAEANSDAVYKRIRLFYDLNTLGNEILDYVVSKKSFNELVEAGQKAYGEKNFNGAEAYFKSAQELKKDNYVPSYFLGLVSYEQKAYDRAEEYYNSALRLGADRALIQYARGVNAAAAGKKTEAIQYLQEAADAAPDKYRTRAEDMIKRLR